MDSQELRERAHDLDVTLWVGKKGIGAVTSELRDQLDERDLVKVKFLPAARAGADADGLAAELADRAGAEVIDTRGHTAVMH